MEKVWKKREKAEKDNPHEVLVTVKIETKSKWKWKPNEFAILAFGAFF